MNFLLDVLLRKILMSESESGPPPLGFS